MLGIRRTARRHGIAALLRAVVGIGLALVLVVLVPKPVAANDLKHKRNRTRQQEQAVKIQIDLAKASDAKVEVEVARLDAAVRNQQDHVDEARRAEGMAANEQEAAAARLAEIEARAVTAQRQLVHRAVDAYMRGGFESAALVALIKEGSMADVVRGQMYLRIAQSRTADAIEQFRAIRGDRAAARALLERARRQAADRAAGEQAVAEELASAKRAQLAAHSTFQARVAALQEESHQLAAQESQIEALIRREQTADAAQHAPPRSSRSRSLDVGLAWPLHGVVTSEYGPRWGGFHPGIDIAANQGTPITAAKSGVVIFAAYNGGYGNLIIIDHGRGLATAYAHLSNISVSRRQPVSQGVIIGAVGSTGHSTGPHLHFEVRINGSADDPRGYEAGDP